ncbi:MAG: M28 family peptidase [Acidobacteria bacterium]|nr:M28 family peptidase [Acidobacteriota bacterium]
MKNGAAWICVVCLWGFLPISAETVSKDEIRAHLRFLSDDLLEGRGMGARGGELAARYIAAQFEAMGLRPAGERGTYFQRVPIVGITADPSLKLEVARGERRIELAFPGQFVGGSQLQEPAVDLDGEMVFVGYGIHAPEFQWDDYKGADLRGKVLLMLVNDPPAEDPRFFGGKALTYYGRWTYKYEEAARRGAAGAVLIHTPESAGYGWQVVENSWGKERFALERRAGEPALKLASWIHLDAARSVLDLASQTFEDLKKQAEQRDFRPVELGLRVRARVRNQIRKFEGDNVLGLLPGSDPVLSKEYVLYTAHYDHLGVGKPVDGDAIYNGAADNGSGVAAMLAIAHAFSRIRPAPRRSLLFLGVAAEESGLLGSEYYAAHPLFPLERTAANINLDEINRRGRTMSLVALGADKSSLESNFQKVAERLGVRLSPDPNPEQGFYFRSDQFNLAKVGVPAVYLDAGLDYVGKPEGWGQKEFEEYNAKRYHQPSDQFDPSWELEGTVQIAEMALRVGLDVANQARKPQWKQGSEFQRK